MACALAWAGRLMEAPDREASCRCSHDGNASAAEEEGLSQVVLRREDMEAVVAHVAVQAAAVAAVVPLLATTDDAQSVSGIRYC